MAGRGSVEEVGDFSDNETVEIDIEYVIVVLEGEVLEFGVAAVGVTGGEVDMTLSQPKDGTFF